MRTVLATTALACLAACTSAPPAASAHAPGTAVQQMGPRLRASSPRAASPHVVPLDDGALARARTTDVQVAFGGRPVACRAVPVDALLQDAGVLPAGSGGARYVLATARDGRRVLFSLGELDPRGGGRRVVVTRDCDDGGNGAGTGRRRVLLALDDATPARRLDGVDALVVVAAP